MSDERFKVISRTRTAGIRPQKREIIVHHTPQGRPSGQIIFRCPFCGGLQFKVSEIQGPDDAPTVVSVLKCGCIRCARLFRIRHGIVEEVGETSRPENHSISDRLRKAGVFYPSERQ